MKTRPGRRPAPSAGAALRLSVLATTLGATTLALPTPALAQAGRDAVVASGVSFAPTLRTGDRHVYRFQSLATFAPPVSPDADADTDAPPPPERYEIDATLRFVVGGYDPDTGVAAVTAAFLEVTLSAEAAGEQASVTRRAPGGGGGDPATPDDSAPQTDLEQTLADLGEALCARVLLIDVAPDGRVGALGGLEGAFDAASLHERTGERALGPFRAARAAQTLASFFRLDTGAQDKTGAQPPRRAPGDTWSLATMSEPVAGVGRVRRTQTMTLASLNDDDATATLTGREQVAIIAQPDGSDPSDAARVRIDADVLDSAIEASWDTSRALLVRRSDRLCMALRATIGAKTDEKLVRELPSVCDERTITLIRPETGE